MDIYIDCEFNSMGGGLISMALVSEDGMHEFYEVVECGETIDPWVKENVMPILNKRPITRDAFQAKLSTFLKQFPAVRIMADFPDDIKHLMESLITGAGEWMMIQPLTLVIEDRLSAKKSKIPHNALADARALRDSGLALEGAG